jgi:glutathione S-transferase
MKLLFSPTSPYVRKVRIVALEKGIASEIEIVPASPFDADGPVVAANPLSKIPALILEDGTALYDSPVICEYLDCLGAGPRLLPPNGQARWSALRLQALADGVLDAAFSSVMELRRPETERSADWIQRWRSAISRSVLAASDMLTAPDAWGLGEISLACALGYVDFRLPDIVWRPNAALLAAWYERQLPRASFAATAPP